MPASRLRVGGALAAVTAAALVLAGCSGTAAPASTGTAAAAASDTTLTVYTDQHAQFIQALTQAYTKKTGVKFNIQEDATVGQLQAEGAASPADVFLSEDPGPVAQLDKAHMTATLPKSTMDQVQPDLSSPDDQWVAYAARARVLYYNPKLISESALPKTLADIVEPQYKGKFAWAPSGAFVATTQYLISTIGLDKTRAFLEKIKANGINEQTNGNVRDTVEAGKHAMGLSNHYYWWIKAGQEGGPSHMVSKIYHFPEVDPGNLVLSSGAAVLKNSKKQAAAQKFIAWLTSADGGQKIVESSDINVSAAQYPVGVGTSSKLVGSIDDIKSPKYDMSIYADQTQAQHLLKTLGMSS